MPNRSPQHQGASCFCFNAPESSNQVIQEGRLDFMHDQSRQLICGWLEKAIEKQDAAPEDSFEPFIYAWLSFNGWAACITNEDRDSCYMQKLIADARHQEQFLAMLKDDQVFIESASAFASMWPIFSVKKLRDQNINTPASVDRASVVQHYLDKEASYFEPQCWQKHHDCKKPCPCDWPHTIAAIYRVRCNLFHGEKAAYSPVDQNIVQAAFRVLVRFMQKADCFEEIRQIDPPESVSR